MERGRPQSGWLEAFNESDKWGAFEGMFVCAW